MQVVAEPFMPSMQPEAIGELEYAATIVDRIASHAAAAPARPAVADPSTRLTYRQLDEQSDQLAAYLRKLGAGPECCVGVLLDRSAEFVVAALAVLKTGAAYLPLDFATPAERAAFILNDADALMLLTHAGAAKHLPPGAWRVVALDGPDAEQIAALAATPPRVEQAPENLACVIYTSGSTGSPKGVEITHANLCNLIAWHQSAFPVTSADRVSQLAGLGFDAAGWEIWPCLTAGASLHIADEVTRRSPQALRDWLVAERITISFVPTVLAEQLLQATWPADTALRTLLTGADRLHRRPTPGLPFVFVNNYGPTECTVVATSGVVSPDKGGGEGPPSIGRPIANAIALILDDALRPVPPGEAGELCLAGALVGRGYRNNAALTAARFATHLPDSGPAQRVYRTGDRVRLLANGEIAFLGRLDNQLKVRGYRIEPAEIVACLDRCPGVQASVVVVRETQGAGPGLVAYVVPARGARPNASDLREFLAARLPDYMIPLHFIAVTAVPMTLNGKLDAAALPAPAGDNLLPNRTITAPAAGPVAHAPGPVGELEQRIGALIASLLELPAVGRDDNFFMLGGHSMVGAQLVAKIGDTFGVKLALRQLFGAPTVAALSKEVARLRDAAGHKAA